jgi:hypothetical protein
MEGYRDPESRIAKTRGSKYTRNPHLLFYEYFRGDNGAGLGASHQTGWTGVIAKLIEIFGHLEQEAFLNSGKTNAFAREEVKV